MRMRWQPNRRCHAQTGGGLTLPLGCGRSLRNTTRALLMTYVCGERAVAGAGAGEAQLSPAQSEGGRVRDIALTS